MTCIDNITIKHQLKHSKQRYIKNPSYKFDDSCSKNKLFDFLLKQRYKYFREKNCRALEFTSKLSYFTNDAHHSQGAFFHVLIDIQNGNRV